MQIQTECVHCGQPLRLQIDSALNFRSLEAQADPRIFVPLVDFARLLDGSIFDAF